MAMTLLPGTGGGHADNNGPSSGGPFLFGETASNVETSIVEIIAAAGVTVAMIGGVVARDRYITRAIGREAERLHARIDRIREGYVRRDDLAGHLARLEKSMDEMRREQRRSAERMDRILAELSRGTGA